MSLLLKVTHGGNSSPVASDNPCTVHSDVVSCSFRREKDEAGSWVGFADLWVREPVKTAMVPGFHENEKYVQFYGEAYLMNENGRTVSTFTAEPSYDL